ncbi:MAG: hypothetical protein FWE48_03610 [Coriobacteriia bacterium]|nr:hypothetical protein [Coriobacteriia bacterium]
MSKWGKYGDTWSECVKAIPVNILQSLTSKQIAQLVDANQDIYQKGLSKEAKEG